MTKLINLRGKYPKPTYVYTMVHIKARPMYTHEFFCAFVQIHTYIRVHSEVRVNSSVSTRIFFYDLLDTDFNFVIRKLAFTIKQYAGVNIFFNER